MGLQSSEGEIGVSLLDRTGELRGARIIKGHRRNRKIRSGDKSVQRSRAYVPNCSVRLRIRIVRIDGNVIVIIDHDDGMSVTNDVENVLASIAADGVDIARHTVIYRDTDMVWDGISTAGGRFSGFFHIRVRDLSAALADVKSRRVWG